MNEKVTLVKADSPFVDKTCRFCAQLVKENDHIVECPRCHSIHHEDCWKEKGGCAKQGCPQIAQAVKPDKPKGDGPLPKTPRSHIIGGVVLIFGIILTMFFWPKPPDPAIGRTKIVFLGEGAFDEQSYLSKKIEEFNASNEEIYIDMQLLPYGSIQQKLIVLMAAQDTPDIISLPEEQFSHFVERNVFLELEEANGEPVFGRHHPGQLAKIGIWAGTENKEAALKVLDFLLEVIPPVDLETLRQLEEQRRSSPIPSTGPIMGF